MKQVTVRFLVWLGMMAMSMPVLANKDFTELKEGEQIAEFAVESVYENELGDAMGARFRHQPTGMVLDLLRIQSIPQAFMWVNSPPPTDQGEPHTCEHLLLGKGTKGRYVASLEEMSLGSSSAFTMQLQTCYHFHTAAGEDVFFQLMEAKLDAMLNPNFTDEEIRREVCNIGYSLNISDSSLELEEKGTVYNEMVSSFERPWSNLSEELDVMLYGQDHPLSNNSGGRPDAIRTMTPEDLWRFHAANYRLGNMGMIVSIPSEISLSACLQKTSDLLARVQPEAELDSDPTQLQSSFPPPTMAPEGEVRTATFPHQNENEPGLLVYAWPPVLELTNREIFLLELLIENLSSGETADLYRTFIDSKTRALDVGATSIFGWVSEDMGNPVYIGLSNVKREMMDVDMIDSIRAIIMHRIQEIASWSDHSDELNAFNERTQNLIAQNRRSLRKFLNSPPGFGFRSSGSRWLGHMKRLQRTKGFRKQLALNDELAFAEQLVATGTNFWTGYLRKWKLDSTTPYAVASRPDASMLGQSETDRQGRIRAFTDELMSEYDTDEASAVRQYKADYDEQTAVIDTEASTIPMPGFVEAPPLSLDDQLDYRTEILSGKTPIVVSTFENITSGTIGLALNLGVVPEDFLLYVPALPTLLTDVGVKRDGAYLSYDEAKEQQRKEILYLKAYHTVNFRSERAELVLKAAGSNLEESRSAARWIATALYDADWRPENLDRIRDAVDLTLKSRRNTMRLREEAWVQDPANAYWKQNNPLLLSADCFLTQTHALHRLRWRLRDMPEGSEGLALQQFLIALAKAGDPADRESLVALLSTLSGEAETISPAAAELVTLKDGLSKVSGKIARMAVDDLSQTLADLPDQSLAADWTYLLNQIQEDLAMPSVQTLDELGQVMSALRHSDNVRAFMIASSSAQREIIPAVTDIINRLSKTESIRQTYDTRPVILSRLKQRNAADSRPLFVGLLNENTRSGVFVNTTPCASYWDTDTEKLLSFLSARLYGGGGAHSMFMKTWGAGLAYSNGLRSNENRGRLIYYAERCPDLPQTMQFVVNELKNAPFDTTLSEYAIAQAFTGYRSGRSYEERGESMAADLADGQTADVVQQFRTAVLALRDRTDLYEDLHNRMEQVYGEVLPGYGPRASESPDAIHFVIGPEAQMQSLEEYLQSVESPDARVVRLYPRDYWLVPASK